jgi:hypothetical protein
VDRYLLHLVPHEDEENPIELDVTLNVGGALVSGKLISEETYFDLMADWFHSAVPNAREDLESFADEAINKRIEEDEDLTEEEIVALKGTMVEAGLAATTNRFIRSYERSADAGKFVHLRNVMIRTDTYERGGLPTDLWRGKLDAVDGFTIGRRRSEREQ